MVTLLYLYLCSALFHANSRWCFWLNIQGFVISDWEGIDRITSPPHSNYTYSVQASVLAGIDMVRGLFYTKPLTEMKEDNSVCVALYKTPFLFWFEII